MPLICWCHLPVMAARGVLGEALPHRFGCHLQALWQCRPCRQQSAMCLAASVALCPPVVLESSIFGVGKRGPPWDCHLR